MNFKPEFLYLLTIALSLSFTLVLILGVIAFDLLKPVKKEEKELTTQIKSKQS